MRSFPSGIRRCGRAALVLLLCVLSRSAAAQTLTPWEVSATYASTKDDATKVSLPLGWCVGVAREFSHWLSAAGEFGRSTKTTPIADTNIIFNLHTFMGGARVTKQIGRLSEFGQVLVGFVHASGTVFGLTSSRVHFGVQPGIGLDYRLTPHLAARGQVDVRYVRAGSAGADTARQLRLAAGIVYAFP